MTSKVLVVDDEPDVKAMILAKFRKSIKTKEYEFYFANNGEEALNMLQENTDLNIILTDINMPVMDGLTLLANLTKLERPYKVIVVSAYGDMSNIRQAMNRGASDFVIKPIDFVDFETTLKKIIGEYETLKNSLETESHLNAIKKELEVAATIQIGMLPKDYKPFKDDRVEIYGKMVPAREVGGDLFDFFPIGSDKLGIFIGDVSGKGIPACLYMAITKYLLRALALKGTPVVDTVEEMNSLVCIDNETSMFITGFFGEIDLTNGKLTYCNAGHNPPYILSTADNTIKQVGTETNIALGISPEAVFKEGTIELKDKDCLYIYTDGITEAMNTKSEEYTTGKLAELLTEKVSASGKDIIESVYSSVLEHAGIEPQSDDITMLTVRYNVKH